MHPADTVFFWARSNPEHPALIQPDMVLTYRELAQAIGTVAQRIAQYGFASDEPVAVSIDQPLQRLIVTLAMMRAGISVAPIDPATLPHLRAHGIYNVIFAGEGLMLSGGRNIRFEDSWLKRDPKSPAPKLAGAKSQADRAKAIFLMPGGGGALRKTVVPSAALMARIRVLPLIGEANYDRVLIAPELSTLTGFCRAAVNLYAGRTACFAASSAAQVLAIKTFGVDALVCTPREAASITDYLSAGRNEPVDSLREVWLEEGAISPDLGGKIHARLCRNIIAGFGTAETGRVAIANFDTLADRPGAVGYVAPHATVEVVGDNGNPLGPGEAGRLRCRTEFFAEVAAASGAEGGGDSAWWYPGQSGRCGDDGMIYIVERGLKP